LLQVTYAAAFGRLRSLSLDFLTRDFLLNLARMKDAQEIADALESTWYRNEIESSASMYAPPELIEVAVNKHLVLVNRLATSVVPLFGKNALIAYLSKWDIENIELILAAKSLGRSIEETEAFLVSSRNLPVGITGNVIPYSDLKLLLQQADVEAVVNQLVKYGYGAVLLQELGDFRRSGDLGSFTGALQKYYYQRLLWELRYFRGDELTTREYVRAEIAKKNVLNMLKSKESSLPKEIYARHIIEGGLIDPRQLLEAYESPGLKEIVRRLEPWFDLSGAVERYGETGNLTEFEVEMDRMLGRDYLPRLRSHTLSVSSVFEFVIRAEYERQNIRKIVYAKQYRMSEKYINDILLVA
jgi:V/A-type H+-transporting ATPase subunit C